MHLDLKKLLAVSLALSLVFSSVPAVAFAEKPEIPVDEALKYLQSQGVFKGEDDPVKSYLFNGSKLSPMGLVLYQYLKAQPNAQEEVQGFNESIENLRKSGAYNDKKEAAVQKALQGYQDKFGNLTDPGATGEDTFRLGVLREAMMTGAAVSDPPKQDFTQVEVKDGWEFWDKDGLAFRMNKNQVTTYNRDLQKSQRAMNESRPPQAPFIPETGRYNFQMLQYSYWRLADQMAELDKAYHIDRMINMAELLGKQYKDDMWFTDRKLEPDLEQWSKDKTFSHHGRTYSVYGIVESKMNTRVAYMGKGREGLADFMGEVEKLKNADSITDGQIASMQLHEQYVMRYLSLVFLESQRYHVKSQLERLDPSSPDSELLIKAINESPMDEATRQQYQREREKLRKRTEHLMTIFAQVEDVLFKSDYAASLDLVQAALNSAQKEMGEISLDYSLFAEMPSASYLAKNQLGGWNMSGWAVKAYWKTRLSGSHSQHMDEVDIMLPQYQKAAEAIARGDYKAARAIVAAMHPDAMATHRELTGKAASGRITDSMRVSASMKQSRELLAKVATTNLWVSKAGNYITWTVSLALAAPLTSWALSGVAKLAAMGARVPLLNIPLRIIEEAALHTAARLDSLSPAPQNISASNFAVAYLKSSGVRFVNAAARQASFTALSGGISGGFTVLSHLSEEHLPRMNLGIIKTGEGHSLYNDSWEAFGEGFKGGVIWANDSWHPALGYVGIPSTVYEGTPFARAAQVLGERGVVGSVGKFAQAIGVPISEKLSLNALANSGIMGKIAAFPLGMADNVAKYALFSQGAGWVGNEISWRSNYAEQDVERRIKRAEMEGQKWMASPAWMLIPVYPAKYEAAASDYQRSLQGKKEYEEGGRRSDLANAWENQELPLLGKPEVPIMQQIFNLRWKGEPQEGATFRVNKEMRRQAIADELLEAVPGGGKGVKASQINPLEFYNITKLSDKDMVGKLHVNDEVRLEAREKFDEAVINNKPLAEKVLGVKSGTEVAGFGRVTPELKREVSHTIANSQAAEKAKEVLALPIGERDSAAKRLDAKAQEILKPYLESDNLPKPFAKRFLEAVRKVTGETPKFDKAVDEMVASVKDWKEGQGNPKNQYNNKSYVELMGELKASAQAKLKAGELTVAEHKVFEDMYAYMDSIEARFNSFNKVGIAESLCAEIVEAARIQHVDSKPALKLVGSFSDRLKTWRSAQGGADGPAIGPNNRAYLEMLGEMNRDLRDAKVKKQISQGEYESLRATLKEMDSAPWVLHDSKGSALPSWRPEQFEGLMTSLGLIAQQGKGGAPIRQFIMLKTGGGKTMMTFEGLLPLAEADAAYHSQVTKGNFGKMEVMFLTVQSNLEAQARLEFMAFKKVGSGLKFETYEGLKTKIADGKLYYKDVAKKTWILGDEMDGAALQPMLTIGEVTARVMKAGGVYHLLEKINDHIETELARRDVDFAEGVKAEARRAQAAVDKIDVLSPEGAAARRLTEKLLRAAEDLSGARTPEARDRAESSIRDLVRQQNKVLESAPLAKSPKLVTALAKTVEDLSALGTKLEKAKGEAGIKKAQGQIDALLKEQQSLIDKAGLAETAQGASVRASAESLRARLARAKDPLKLVKETVKSQQQVLEASSWVDAAQTLAVRQAGDRIIQKMGERRVLEGKDKARVLSDAGTAAKQQSNLLELIKDDAPERINAMRQKAQALRVDAEKRYNALLKKNAQSPELARIQDEIRIAKQFETGSPQASLARQEAFALRAEAQTRLEALGQETGRLDAQIEALRKTGGPTEGLEARLSEIGKEISAAQSQFSQAGKGFAPTAAEMPFVRKLFSDNSADILKLMEEGKPGWEGQALDHLAMRQQLLESFAYSENPIYKVYRQMKEDMYPHAMSEIRQQDDAQILKDVSREAKKVVHGSITDIVDVLRESKTGDAAQPRGKLEAVLKEEIAQRQAKAGTFEEMRSYLEGAKDRGARFKEALDALRVESAQDPKLTSRIDSALQGLVSREASLTQGEGYVRMSADKAAKLWNKRIDGEDSLLKLGLIYAKKRFTGETMAVDEVGLSRMRAAQLLKAVLMDPVMPPGQQHELFWTILPSVLWPKGVTGKGNSWVRTEMINMGRGYFENPATIRMDNLTGNINVVHNGQWFESMDNAGRRWWELEYGTDLTLPYKHKTVSTIKDITENKKTHFISLSGTAGNEFRSHLRENDVRVGGTGSTTPDNVKLDIRTGAADKFASVKEALLAARANSEARVIVSPRDRALPAAVKSWFEEAGVAKKETAVLKIDDAPKGEVRDFLLDLKKNQSSSGLVVLSLSDTRVLKSIRKYLIRSGMATESEIAQVFSDSEYLRLNRPQARVQDQMNLNGLNDGKVKVLMLDTRVGGRGLDLNFKGDRENAEPGAFKGYTNFEMAILDPQEMSSVHLLQAEGRIDLGRVLPGAIRNFSLVMDVKAVEKEPMFRQMYNEDPYFGEIRNDPAVLEFARKLGRPVDWALIHDYISATETRVAAIKKPKAADLAVMEKVSRYYEVVGDWLDKRQSEVEKDQLRQSSVLQDKPFFDPKFRGLELAR